MSTLAGGTLDLRVLWRQHNEHRIVFPELAFACDMRLAHGRLVLPIAPNVLLYFGMWVVMSPTFAGETAGQGLEWHSILRWPIPLAAGPVISPPLSRR